MFDITKPINPTYEQLKELNAISKKVSNDLDAE
jgi:hypothetical protein